MIVLDFVALAVCLIGLLLAIWKPTETARNLGLIMFGAGLLALLIHLAGGPVGVEIRKR